MSDKEKFVAFKEKMIRENEEKYGAEIRERCGDEEIDASNRKMMNMSQEEWEQFLKLEEEIKKSLEKGVRDGIEPDSEEAKRIVLLHGEWLKKTWKNYTPEAHKGVAAMYIADERFKSYYDQEAEGCAKLLEAAVRFWA